MGVSGSGKTTIGKLLAEKMKIPFFEGDDFHPMANKEKMKSGIALTDKDRKGWLTAINKSAREEAMKKGAVFACSALKENYRKILAERIYTINWVFLDGSFSTIEKRMKARKNHFMPLSLLQSQFEILEIPSNAIRVNVSKRQEEIVAEILAKI